MEAKYTEHDLNLARLAAYIDGEGTIDLQRTIRGEYATVAYKLRVLIVNTDLRLLVWCKETFGGQVRVSRKGTKKKSPLYVWTITGPKYAGILLAECLPFFVIKREQAELGIAFGKTFSPSNRDPRGLNASIKRQREDLCDKVCEIRRVKPDPESVQAA